jgi:hypothetical protein
MIYAQSVTTSLFLFWASDTLRPQRRICVNRSCDLGGMKILFLGPCRKQDRRTGNLYLPFDPETLSGQYTLQLKNALSTANKRASFSASNIIDGPCFAPGSTEERNPDLHDLVQHWPVFERRVARMCIEYIVAFGTNVREAFGEIDCMDYRNYELYERGPHKIVFSHHPSFIMVYRRKKIGEFIDSVIRAMRLERSEIQGRPFRSPKTILGSSTSPARSAGSRPHLTST